LEQAPQRQSRASRCHRFPRRWPRVRSRRDVLNTALQEALSQAFSDQADVRSCLGSKPRAPFPGRLCLASDYRSLSLDRSRRFRGKVVRCSPKPSRALLQAFLLGTPYLDSL
jgi:hypothetical protein